MTGEMGGRKGLFLFSVSSSSVSMEIPRGRSHTLNMGVFMWYRVVRGLAGPLNPYAAGG